MQLTELPCPVIPTKPPGNDEAGYENPTKKRQSMVATYELLKRHGWVTGNRAQQPQVDIETVDLNAGSAVHSDPGSAVMSGAESSVDSDGRSAVDFDKEFTVDTDIRSVVESLVAAGDPAV